LVVPVGEAATTGPKVGIRLTTDSSAPMMRPLDVNRLYPYRMKELVKALNARFGTDLTDYDILCVRAVFGVVHNPQYYYHPNHGSKLYSEEFLNFMFKEYEGDPKFFENAERGFKEMTQHAPSH
jgi:hypothetical protein